jgi:replication factor C subunit 3/5
MTDITDNKYNVMSETQRDNESIPWMEKYRPSKITDIVLDHMNKDILNNIIETGYFPNLLFYGPPGTGKTTTIINLINAYQEKRCTKNKGLMIHLNASDERGIDIIRNQISMFVNSNPLFNNGMKFVILDEVDYMTKNAQQALIYLLHNYSQKVRFCLICNYISRIDEGLQNEFIKMHFNQLPEEDIIGFLKNINVSEKLNMSNDEIVSIQKLYRSDIRSMINFMQSKQGWTNKCFVIGENVWISITDFFEKVEENKKDVMMIEFKKIIQETSVKYNINKKNIMNDYFNYLIRTKEKIITVEFLSGIEKIIHFQDCSNENYLNYSYYILYKLFSISKSKIVE